MSRHPRRKVGEGGEPRLLHRYEGLDALSALLARAGSPHRAEAVAERFREAQASGEERSAAIPQLFAGEPRFTSLEEASRLYGNLFGLWDRIAAGAPVEAEAAHDVDEAVPRRAPPLPARGAASGPVLEPQLVEAVWKHLDALAGRERRRLRDRFEGAQPDLVAWLDARQLDAAAAVAAADLAFEVWAMFDVVHGERLEAVAFAELRALEPEPVALEATQPALAAYVAEALDLVEDEEASFGEASRAQVERTLAVVASAFASALLPEDEG